MSADPESTPTTTPPVANPSPSLTLVKELKREEIVFTLARVPGTHRVIFGGSDFRIHDVDLAEEKPESHLLGDRGHESYVTGLAMASTGRRAVSGGYDGKLMWWDLERRECPLTVVAHTKWIRDVAATTAGPAGAGAGTGGLIASVADDMICRLWDAETGSLRHELRGHELETPHNYPSMLFACAFTPDGRHLATGDKVGHVVIWDVDNGQAIATLEAPTMYTWDPVQRRHSIGGIRALAFTPDGNGLAVGGIARIGNVDHLDAPARVEVFDWRKGERTHEFSDLPKGIVESLAFHPDGHRLVAVGGANDGFLALLDLKSRSVLAQLKAPAHLHDALLGDCDCEGDFVFTAAHGKVAVYEMKG